MRLFAESLNYMVYWGGVHKLLSLSSDDHEVEVVGKEQQLEELDQENASIIFIYFK